MSFAHILAGLRDILACGMIIKIMNTITIKQLAHRISSRINAEERKNRDHVKNDFIVGTPLPKNIYDEFISEFHDYSQIQINEFTRELTKLVEA